MQKPSETLHYGNTLKTDPSHMKEKLEKKIAQHTNELKKKYRRDTNTCHRDADKDAGNSTISNAMTAPKSIRVTTTVYLSQNHTYPNIPVLQPPQLWRHQHQHVNAHEKHQHIMALKVLFVRSVSLSLFFKKTNNRKPCNCNCPSRGKTNF